MEKRTLRLIFTPICNRKCAGCCNKDFDLFSLPSPDHFDYDEIFITGGEPLLFHDELIGFIRAIRLVSKAKIYVYTAFLQSEILATVLNYVDGITLTLHTKKDWETFNEKGFIQRFPPEAYQSKSMRLNIFRECEADVRQISSLWRVKNNIDWIVNCPLPINEVLMKAY